MDKTLTGSAGVVKKRVITRKKKRKQQKKEQKFIVPQKRVCAIPARKRTQGKEEKQQI